MSHTTSYACQSSSNINNETTTLAPPCVSNCVGVQACLACHFASNDIQTECETEGQTAGAGPWGPVMDVFFCLFPIFFLIIATTNQRMPLPATWSMPIAALLMYVVRLMYLGENVILASGCIVLGLNEALTPISIMAGAITLFETMRATNCLIFMTQQVKHLTHGHPVAESMLIFAFSCMAEGVSGLGAVLGAPLLVETGHGPLESVVALLVLCTFASVWGAVGIPFWFGLGNLGLSKSEMLEISQKSAVTLAINSILVVPWVLTVLMPWRIVKGNLMFVYASTVAIIGPTLGIAFVNYELPSVVGGLLGFIMTAALIKFRVGLKAIATSDQKHEFSRHHVVAQDGSIAVPHQTNVMITHSYPLFAGDLVRSSHHVDIEGVVDDTTDIESFDGDICKGDPEPASGGETNGKTSPISHHSQCLVREPHEACDADTTGMPAALVVDCLPGSQAALDLHSSGPRKEWSQEYVTECLSRTFPIWGAVTLLTLTHVDQIGIKPYLTQQTPYLEISLGTYGTFRLSASAVFQLKNILTYPGLDWQYPLFFVPLVPFVIVSLVTMLRYHKELQSTPSVLAHTIARQLVEPGIAMTGALILVELMMQDGGPSAPANIIGNNLAEWFQQGFVVVSPILGAVGSFFSGSVTVSNLMFGQVQRIAAERLGTSVTSMLALQSVGGSAGNAISLCNIILSIAVVRANIRESSILRQTYKFALTLTTIATVVIAIFVLKS